MKTLKVILSGGGTGGHIFPAIAIANAIKKLHPSTEFLFVGALGKMEMEKVPAAGFKIVGLPVAGFQRRITLKNLLFPFKLMASLRKAKKVIRDFNPDIAIGTGGYASGPILRIASKAGIPSIIQEQNSFPGITNKILAKNVSKICVAYKGMEKFFPAHKIVYTGNPVRQDLIGVNDKKEEAKTFFQIASNQKVVLIIGGSLGARTINESIASNINKIAGNNISIIWQTGKAFFDQAKKFESDKVKVFDFISRMDMAYAVADIVVSRAGAISISELCVVEKAIILVPSPNVSEDHQTKNAIALVNEQAAIMVKDIDAREKLMDVLVDLLSNQERINELKSNIKKIAKPNAADEIAAEALRLIEK